MHRSIVCAWFLLLPSLAVNVFAKQASLACSVHPKRGASAESLATLATVHQADAERIARESLHTAASITVTEGELEVERGCLVYSFDMRVAGKNGAEEVGIDAGTGKVLFHEHESTKQEEAEKEAEKKGYHLRQ